MVCVVHLIRIRRLKPNKLSSLFAVYRTERTCLSSADVTAESNKCYAEFQQRLTFIANDEEKRHPHAYVCLLLYVRDVFV